MRSENAVEHVLAHILPRCWRGIWLSMDEISDLTKLHPSIVRWVFKQLRKDEAYLVRRRMREPKYRGVHEYYVKRRPVQEKLKFSEPSIPV